MRGSRITNAETDDLIFSCCCSSWNTFSPNLHQEPVLSYLFAICLLCLLLFQCLSVHCCSWMDFQPPYLDQWTTFLGFIATFSAKYLQLPPSVANFAFANSFPEAPNASSQVQISKLPVWNILTKWDSPGFKAGKPRAMYELCHKGCHKRDPDVSPCIWAVLYIFLSQAAPYIQLALEISQVWDTPFPTGLFFSFYSL